jgi:L-cysteate sulfo-lyase
LPGLDGDTEKPDLRSNAGKAAVATVMNQVADELRAQGHKPYILPGSGQPVGVLGYLECALELALQCAEKGLEPNWIFLTSSGVGQAGLLLGAKFLQQPYRIAGCAPDPDRSDAARSADVAGLANRAAQLFDIGIQIEPTEVINLNYGGEAYGIITQAGMEAMHLVAQTEGIFLDPVYNAKGMSGLIDQIRQGVIGADDTVIYINTGGGPLNFAYNQELTQAFDLSLEGDRMVG